MQKSKIEWTDYTINPVKGLCPVGCSYCYARRMYKRFHWDETIRFDQTAFFKLPNKPSRIFVGSTMELFGDWVQSEWLNTILTICRQHHEHTFIFLTKQPQNLPKEFPDNCWVGVSVTDQDSYERALKGLSYVGATVRFMSFEPLLKPIDILGADFGLLHWLIIGQQTPVSAKTTPKIEWIQEIVEAADKAKIPVFLKDNLMEVFHIRNNKAHIYFPAWATARGFYRQEFPIKLDSKER